MKKYKRKKNKSPPLTHGRRDLPFSMPHHGPQAVLPSTGTILEEGCMGCPQYLCVGVIHLFIPLIEPLLRAESWVIN